MPENMPLILLEGTNSRTEFGTKYRCFTGSSRPKCQYYDQSLTSANTKNILAKALSGMQRTT